MLSSIVRLTLSFKYDGNAASIRKRLKGLLLTISYVNDWNEVSPYFNIGVNIDATMQRSVGARGVSGVKQIAIASDSVRGDLITENYCRPR